MAGETNSGNSNGRIADGADIVKQNESTAGKDFRASAVPETGTRKNLTAEERKNRSATDTYVSAP